MSKYPSEWSITVNNLETHAILPQQGKVHICPLIRLSFRIYRQCKPRLMESEVPWRTDSTVASRNSPLDASMCMSRSICSPREDPSIRTSMSFDRVRTFQLAGSATIFYLRSSYHPTDNPRKQSRSTTELRNHWDMISPSPTQTSHSQIARARGP